MSPLDPFAIFFDRRDVDYLTRCLVKLCNDGNFLGICCRAHFSYSVFLICGAQVEFYSPDPETLAISSIEKALPEPLQQLGFDVLISLGFVSR